MSVETAQVSGPQHREADPHAGRRAHARAASGATFSQGSTTHIVEHYLNCGAAGRFQHLIWCVEIEGGTDRIVSWSRINGKLTRIAWRSNKSILEHESKTVVD